MKENQFILAKDSSTPAANRRGRWGWEGEGRHANTKAKRRRGEWEDQEGEIGGDRKVTREASEEGEAVV